MNALRVTRSASAPQGHQPRDTSARWLREELEPLLARRLYNHSVLVPLDGSQVAEQALPSAIAVAQRSGAAIQLVLVQSPSVKLWQQYCGGTSAKRLLRERQAYLQSVVRRIRSQVDAQITAMAIEGHDIQQSLCKAATGAGLVVMATRGRSFLGRLLHRSVSSTLMQSLPCPLLLVSRHDPAVELSSDKMFRNVLIPLDGTQNAGSVAAAAGGWLERAECTLVHFQNWEQTFSRSGLPDPHGYLRLAAEDFKRHCSLVRTEVIVTDQPVADAILSRVEEKEFDLIALTTNRHEEIAGLLARSVTDSVVRGTTIPVLIFPPASSTARATRTSPANSSEVRPYSPVCSGFDGSG